MGSGVDAAEVVVVAEDPARATQAPSDVIRLAVGAMALLVVVLVGLFWGDGVVAFVSDLFRGLDQLPSWLISTVGVLGQLAAVLLLVSAVVVAARLHSFRLLVAVVVAMISAVVLAWLLTSVVDATADRLATITPVGAAGRSDTWPSVLLAALTALFATVGPWTSRRWRRISWVGLLCIAVSLFVASPVAFGTAIGLLSGWVAGTAVNVVAGSPSHRPTGASIAAGLAAVGVPLARLEQVSLDARGSTPYFGETVDGSKLFVKALGNDERSADLMFRAYRRLQPRDLGDEKAFSTLRRAVEHEALVALSAHELGVRTPRLVAFATVEPDGCALAYEAIAGRSLDRISPDEMTDGVLDGVWTQLALLRSRRVAHRDLRLANVFMADDGELWIIDFGFSELSASDLLLATDLAEFIASSAVAVGPERAIDAAVRALGASTAATALDRMELPRLSGATRTALKADRPRFEALRSGLSALTAPTAPT